VPEPGERDDRDPHARRAHHGRRRRGDGGRHPRPRRRRPHRLRWTNRASPSGGSVERGAAELKEETGFHGGRWRKLAGFYVTPGICNEYTHVYLAEDVEPGEPEREEGEDIEVVHWPVDELPARLGELEDATTLVALLLYLRGAPAT
jgi:8-oxo-dGTP pyrophosphatase MutT (NUDIX family)